MRRTAGYTLLELLICVVIITILFSLSVPVLNGLRSSSAQKAAARRLFAALHQARSCAVSDNLEYQVAFDLDTQTFWLERGNRAEKSTTWERVRDFGSFSASVDMKALADCRAETGQRRIQFNPDGTANSLYICAVDPGALVQYRAGIPVARTGRPKIQRRTSSKCWQ